MSKITTQFTLLIILTKCSTEKIKMTGIQLSSRATLEVATL